MRERRFTSDASVMALAQHLPVSHLPIEFTVQFDDLTVDLLEFSPLIASSAQFLDDLAAFEDELLTRCFNF